MPINDSKTDAVIIRGLGQRSRCLSCSLAAWCLLVVDCSFSYLTLTINSFQTLSRMLRTATTMVWRYSLPLLALSSIVTTWLQTYSLTLPALCSGCSIFHNVSVLALNVNANVAVLAGVQIYMNVGTLCNAVSVILLQTGIK